MRHRKAGRHLNRTSSHRKAMFSNMAASLFLHEQIKTTLPKAKELRRVAEPLITLAKTASVANRRAVFARLRERDIVSKLFDDLGPHFADRPGGYLRILKCGNRPGDNAPMAYVQLVDRDLGLDAEEIEDDMDEMEEGDEMVEGNEIDAADETKDPTAKKAKAKDKPKGKTKSKKKDTDEAEGMEDEIGEEK